MKPDTTYTQRRDEVVRLVSAACHRWFDSGGNWIHPVQVAPDGEWVNPPQKLPSTFTRLAFWLCMGLMDGSDKDVALANAVLSRSKFYLHVGSRSDEENQSPFDIFVTNHAMQMLALHGKKLEARVKEKIEIWARTGLRDYMGNRQGDYQFHGFNDNMPAKATLGLVLGGEYFRDEAALAHGLWNLRQLRDLLSRRGLFSEYCSPTYTPFTLVNLTEVAQHAQNSEARQLASQCVERLWADVLGHFHAPTGIMAGPYSRAYHFDSVAHLSSMSFLLWQVLGDGVFPNPLVEFKKEPVTLLHPHGFCPEALGRLSWIASCRLEPPAYLSGWLESRTYPFECTATAERGGGGGSESHASEVLTTQYQEEDFALGTAEGETWSQGQSDVFHLVYRRTRPATRLEDIRVAYLRYLINEEGPKDPAESLGTHATIHTIQHQRTALVLARPSLKLAGQPLQRLKLSMLLPVHFGEVENIRVEQGHVFIEDGTVRLALRPLNPSSWGGKESLKVERVDHYQLLSFLNYEGEPRVFSREELARTLNGFVFTIGLKEEGTMASFEEKVLSASCVDYWHFGSRTVRYQSGESVLEMSYSPESDHVRYASINGRLVPRPLWQAPGLAPDKLPFLEGSATPNAVEMPYRHLKVVWDPQAPWIISSNGKNTPLASHGEGWRQGN